MAEENQERRHTGSLYGAFAFGSVVLACYAGYFTTNYFYTSAAMVPWVFGLGALYTYLSVFGTLAGKMLVKLDRKNEGREQFLAALKVVPNFEAATKALGELDAPKASHE